MRDPGFHGWPLGFGSPAAREGMARMKMHWEATAPGVRRVYEALSGVLEGSDFYLAHPESDGVLRSRHSRLSGIRRSPRAVIPARPESDGPVSHYRPIPVAFQLPE